MITLPKTLTVDACENVIEQLQKKPNSQLQLSVDTKFWAFSGLASAVQCSLTWGRNSECRELYLKPSTRGIEADFEDILNRPHKFAAAMFASHIFSGQKNDVRNDFYSCASSRIDQQQKSQSGINRGELSWFIFIDHSSKGFDRNFYQQKQDLLPAPRQMDQVKSVIGAMMKKSLPGASLLPSDDAKDQIGRVFYELFLNTHEHGSRELNRSKWIKPGLRVIYTNGITLTPEGVDGTVKADPVLSKFVEKKEGRSKYMEISMIDSGMGFLKRWRADRPSEHFDDSLEGEYSVFKKCFSFRQSSSGLDHKGNGLSAVMERLTNLNGFMKIRSGRLSLYRNFVSSPYQPGDSCDFYDWKTELPARDGLTDYSPVVGAAVTILIPLENKQ
ncbi:hypothetical protein [Neptuniibacter pectenicola]|uniref:hypothetical protein n=1 Tax=Neptuniibacter pectenicola TaxID=1806669 RepID=UPI0030EDB27F